MAFYENVCSGLKATFEELKSKPQISMFVDRGVCIEGHGGILTLSDTEIEFKYKAKVISVCGNNLEIKELTDTDAYVTGKPVSISIKA